MKRIILITFIILVALQLNAQLVYDEWGNIIPFSFVESYKDEIEAYSIPTYIIPFMDNDSLCKIYNNGKSIEELENRYIGGFSLYHEPISLKEKGVCIDLGHGKLWRYAIEGASAGGIGFDLGFPKLTKGTYIAEIAADTTSNLVQPTMVYHSENLLKSHKIRGLSGSVDGKKLILEYYEPDTLKEKDEIALSISYIFVGFGKQKSSSHIEPVLKSGFYGSSDFSGCQKDINCPDVENFLNEAKSVVFIRCEFRMYYENYSELHYYNGTGFFLNKVGGYNSNDYPILVTAGHLYHFLDIFSPIDIDSYINKFLVVTQYHNKICGTDDTNDRGIVLPGLFNRIALGSSWDKANLPGYSPNDDYALLQAGSIVNELSSHDLVYGAWSKNHNFNSSSNVEYFCIHHPKGDVKKINKDNHKVDEVLFNGFKLKYDSGLAETGSSGSPVFNSSRQIVGFHLASLGNRSCELIGQITSLNGTLNSLYSAFGSLLDPSGTGQATSSNPQPPQPSELPSHCRDCIQNGDETGMDCGGSCFPCGIQDVVRLKSLMDIPGKVKSRYEILAQPDPNTLLTLKGGSYSFEAGMNVYLKGGFEVEKGAVFYAGIDAGLMSEADRGCGGICVYAPSIPITPNGDGLNDYWAFSQAFAVKYSIEVKNRWNQTIYIAVNQPIHENGWILAWDGSGATQDSGYGILLVLTDCLGNTHTRGYVVNVYGLKSAGINENHNIEIESKDIDNSETKIKFYPNPFNDKVTLSYSGEIFPIVCKVSDINGKVVFDRKLSSAYEFIDLAGLASGTYIIQAKAGQYNIMEKLIKK
jgi:hypothetical protein